MTKIIYLGSFKNPYLDPAEKHIKYSLELLGHQVIPFDEQEFDSNALLKEKGDIFLFHKGGIVYGKKINEIMNILTKIDYKKVCWYLDAIGFNALEGGILRENWVEHIIPYVDFMFMTDGTWKRRHKYKNTYELREGIGNENITLGKYKEKYAFDIAFLGSIYGDRDEWSINLKNIYKDKFKIIWGIWRRDLYDFCASCKIILAPPFPGNTFYWSSRIYQTLGSGGFLIHPEYEGLRLEDGLIAGKHYIGYKSFKEMKEKIDYYLNHKKEREKIRMEGYKYCIHNLTFQHRLKKMLEIIKYAT